jgi:hypothetical protein
MRRITLKHTLVAALAAGALVASTANAKPTDRVDRYASPTSSLAGTVEKQDLRGEHAQDAARFNGQTAKPPVYWSYGYEAPVPPAQPVSAPAHKPTGGDSDLWLILGIALAATAIVATTAVAANRRSRIRVAA